MLMNFCDPCLLSEAICNTVSNEGNEVANLTNGSDNGFIAYYAVRPPVHIDFKFICKIQLSHIIIWSSVGAQKSSGFKLSIKPNQNSVYNDVITVFLNPEHSGVFLYRNDFDYSSINKPSGFFERYIQLSKFLTINATDHIRISILKTENSVPAIKKVEVWGKVSHVCHKTTKVTLETLWNRRYNNLQSTNKLDVQILESNNKDKHVAKANEIMNLSDNSSFDVPEDFLDPITYEIMIRPVVLPSGNIIDHSTLEKHEKSEATWGRKLSDPFTGLPFNENRTVIPALALKERIDKFLLANSNNEEIKKMPRVLGSKLKRPTFSSNILINKQEKEISTLDINNSKKRKFEMLDSKIQKTHSLPFSMITKSNNIGLVRKNKIQRSNVIQNDSRQIANNQSALKSLHEINKNNISDCSCCINRILYKLPCNHVICRKVLFLSKDKCSICNASFNTNDPVRIYI